MLQILMLTRSYRNSIALPKHQCEHGSKIDNMHEKVILTSLSLSRELSASLGATDDVVSRSDALPLSSDVPGSFAIVSEFWNWEKKERRKSIKITIQKSAFSNLKVIKNSYILEWTSWQKKMFALIFSPFWQRARDCVNEKCFNAMAKLCSIGSNRFSML